MSDLISPSIPHPFTQSQLKVMLAICQVFLSPLSDSDTHQLLKNYKFKITNDKVRKQPQDLENFAKFDLQTTPNYFQEFIQKLLDSSLPDQVFQNKLVMDALSTSLGCYLLCGSRFVPFYDLSLSERESSCQKWSVSSLLEIRGLFKVMKSIALMSFYGNYADLKSVSNAIGYNRVDTITNVDINTKLKSIFIPTFLNVNISDTLALHLKTQIVIVGSGCGGLSNLTKVV